jgi:hypothetical protein
VANRSILSTEYVTTRRINFDNVINTSAVITARNNLLQLLLNDKSKNSPTTHPWRRRRERIYSSYSFTTSAVDGCEWSASRPGRALLPGKRPTVPIAQESG